MRTAAYGHGHGHVLGHALVSVVRWNIPLLNSPFHMFGDLWDCRNMLWQAWEALGRPPTSLCDSFSIGCTDLQGTSTFSESRFQTDWTCVRQTQPFGSVIGVTLQHHWKHQESHSFWNHDFKNIRHLIPRTTVFGTQSRFGSSTEIILFKRL